MIHFRDIECSVGIVFPAAAKIHHIVDTADLIAARESQPERIILAVARIGHFDLAKQGRIECPRSTQSVDPERIVSAIIGCPLFVIDDAGRDHLHIEVRHHVCAYNHRTLLFVEGIDRFLQRMFVFVHIVAVELYGKFTAGLVMYAGVPAPADPEVGAFRDQMDHTLIGGVLADGFGRAVGRMIIDDNQVIFECRLLI